MKLVKLIVVLLLLAATGVGDAMADRSHRSSVHFGFMFGPYWGPWYPGYAAPYYPPPYYPPIVVERAPPPVYIEQADESAAVAEAPAAYWYYCAAAKGYYPYVKTCAGGWQKVAPRPAD